jgi:hypothetical protein
MNSYSLANERNGRIENRKIVGQKVVLCRIRHIRGICMHKTMHITADCITNNQAREAVVSHLKFSRRNRSSKSEQVVDKNISVHKQLLSNNTYKHTMPKSNKGIMTLKRLLSNSRGTVVRARETLSYCQ